MKRTRPIINRMAVRRIFKETCQDFQVYRMKLSSGFFDHLEKHVEGIIRYEAASAPPTRKGKAAAKNSTPITNEEV